MSPGEADDEELGETDDRREVHYKGLHHVLGSQALLIRFQRQAANSTDLMNERFALIHNLFIFNC